MRGPATGGVEVVQGEEGAGVEVRDVVFFCGVVLADGREGGRRGDKKDGSSGRN